MQRFERNQGPTYNEKGGERGEGRREGRGGESLLLRDG